MTIKMKEDVRLLIEQGDLTSNTYFNGGIQFASLALLVIAFMGGIVFASNNSIAVFGILILIAIYLALALHLLLDNQDYRHLRYRLVTKILVSKDYSKELEKLKDYLEKRCK